MIPLASALLAVLGSEACLLHGVVQSDIGRVERDPFHRTRSVPQPSGARTAITNVRVFNGSGFQESATVFIENDTIILSETVLPNDTIVDAKGGVLLPGLIDSHCHPGSVADLESLASFGVTTAMSMSCLNYTVCAILRKQPGLASFFAAGYPAQGQNSSHAMTYGTPINQLIYNASQAPSYVDYVLGNHSDYLKITAEINGPDQDTQDALVSSAHAVGLPTMTHASTLLAFQQAVLSKSDGIQHVPIDANLSSDYFELMLAQNQYGTPTMEAARLVLTLAETMPDIGAIVGVGSSASNGNSSYANWRANAAAMHRAGVPMLAGTDSAPAVSAVLNGTSVFGWSLHNELANLVDAGLSPAEALRAATELAAQKHRLADRGRIAPGMRADLLLLEPGADPLANITDTRRIAKVWIGGLEYEDIGAWNQSVYSL